MALDVVLNAFVLKTADVHLSADTVDLGNTIRLPFLYPVDE